MKKKEILSDLNTLLLLFEQEPETIINNVEWVKTRTDARQYVYYSAEYRIRNILEKEKWI